jgi:hypothetical protein
MTHVRPGSSPTVLFSASCTNSATRVNGPSGKCARPGPHTTAATHARAQAGSHKRSQQEHHQ